MGQAAMPGNEQCIKSKILSHDVQKPSGAWTMDFESWKPDSAEYENVDSELRMRLTTLYFFCNRPTVGALMAFGGELGDAFKAGDGQPEAEPELRQEEALQPAESSASELDFEPGGQCRSSSS